MTTVDTTPDPTQAGCPFQAEPTAEHRWLQRLLGEWSFASEMATEPGQPPMTSSGRCITRPLGELWILQDGSAEMPGGDGAMRSMLTLGYDPAKGKFVGTFIASVMTYMWIYEGSLDAAGKTLTLDAEGPGMAGGGAMARYQDIVTIESDDHWLLSSQILGPDGAWQPFMTAHYRREK